MSSATTSYTRSTSTTMGTAGPTSATGFRFRTTVRNPSIFLYNTGPISSLTDPNWNRSQTYDVTVTSSGALVFAGQRADAFFVDLGAIFDLGDLRPFENLHSPLSSLKAGAGVNATDNLNVHSIAL